jgi:hypothetical protein
MEPKVKNTGIRSGGNGDWAVAPGAHVAITFLGLYYAGRGVISKILCRDPLLVEVKIIEVSPAIEVEIPFPVGDLRRISQCAGREVIWEAEHLRPYGALSAEPLQTVGGPPTLVPEDVMPAEELFTLAKGMVIALVDTDAPLPRCAAIGIIEECSPKGVWNGFVVPHSFFVIVRVEVVNWEYKNHAAYCESPTMQTLGCAAGHKILWSGYKVRPLHVDRTSPQSWQDSTTSQSRELEMRRSPKDVATAAEVGGLPTQSSAAAAPRRTLQSESTEDGTDANRSMSASHGSGSTAAPSLGNSEGSLQYPPRPLWRGRHYKLLNEDLSVFGRA